MKYIGFKGRNKYAAQGEAALEKIPDDYAIPDNAKPVEPVGGTIIVSHSETRHHHVMAAPRVKMYTLPESITRALLVVDEPDVLTHLRDFDTHESITFDKGKYMVRLQQERTGLEGWRRVRD